jgi:hypothetical protein
LILMLSYACAMHFKKNNNSYVWFLVVFIYNIVITFSI